MSQRLRFNTARELFEAFPAAVEDMVATPTDRPALEFLAPKIVEACGERFRGTVVVYPEFERLLA